MSSAKFCMQCGNELEPGADSCKKCGSKFAANTNQYSAQAIEIASPKSAITALLLCIFLGAFGAHRFYVGKIGTGILMLLTAGGLGIWTLVDLVLIASCEFKDKEGLQLIFTRGRASPVKRVLTIIGSIIAILIVYVTLLFSLVYVATSSLTAVVHDQLAAIRAEDLEKAYYSYTAKEFQNATSLETFKQFVDAHPAFKNNRKASFTQREITQDEGTLRGTLTATDGVAIPVEYHLIKEDHVWKILNIRIPAGLETEENVSAADNNTILTYTEKNNLYTINYPGSWQYEQTNAGTVMFSGKKGTSAYFSSVSVQVILSKKAGGVYKNTKDAAEDLKRQIYAGATEVKIIDEGTINLPKNPAHFHGRAFSASYTYKGIHMKKLQYVIGADNGKLFYSWGYTAPLERYPTTLPTAKTMFESWNIQK